METIERLTRSINVFVRFLESVNCLFWQLDWLRQNCLGRSSGTFLVVCAVLLLCVALTLPEEALRAAGAGLDQWLALPASSSERLLRALPLVLLGALLGSLVCRRWQQNYEELAVAEPQDFMEQGAPSAPMKRNF